jgi:hypothetical protein
MHKRNLTGKLELAGAVILASRRYHEDDLDYFNARRRCAHHHCYDCAFESVLVSHNQNLLLTIRSLR